MRSTVYVFDYERMGKCRKAAMLHRPDCPHQMEDGTSRLRQATNYELRALPVCADCQRREDEAGKP